MGDVKQVSRDNIFNDVIHLYEDVTFHLHYPMEIEFRGESGFDLGGVQRDLFTSFWEKAYMRFLKDQKHWFH